MRRDRPRGGRPKSGTANPGRVAAVRVLMAVEEGHHAEQVLAELAPPDGPDRGLAWNLVLGVLRRRGSLDALLEPRLSQGVRGLDPAVRAILRAGLFDALLTRTPPHAAVHQAVEVARAVGAVRASRLVNAVLRRASSEQLADDPWLDLPAWLAERWAQWGSWVERLSEPPSISVVMRGAVPEGLVCEPALIGGAVLQGVYTLGARQGRLESLPGYEDGAWGVMDPAAVAVADFTLRHTPDGGRVLDACAAPGGKALRLSSRGCDVVVTDQSARRLSLLRGNAQRLGMTFEAHVHQWGAAPSPDIGQFSTVLVDAPCTGLGTVRRHPEIRWRCMKSDPAAMGIRQAGILQAASAHVEPGGVLIYAVCSPEPEEGPDVVARLEGWKVIDRWASVPPAGDEDAPQVFALRREDD